MGAIDFPSNPTDQQVFSSGGVTYLYNASIGAWLTSYVSTPLYTSANTQVLYNDDGQSKGNTGLVFDRRANTLIVNNLVAAGSNVASVINSAFGRANTALQNTSGTFAGDLSLTGNVGIGQAATAMKLDVNGLIHLNYYSGTGAGTWYDGQNYTNRFFLGCEPTGNTFRLWDGSASANRLLVDSSGNVVIGASSTSYKLQVNGSFAATSITETSSITYKENVESLESTDLLYYLRPVVYDRKGSKKDTKEPGLIAEEVYQFLPELVSLNAEGKPDGIHYSKLTVYLLNEIKNLKLEVERLKSK